MNKVESKDKLAITEKWLKKYDKSFFIKAIQETCNLMLPFIVLFVIFHAILHFPSASFRHLITEGKLAYIGYVINYGYELFFNYIGIVVTICITYCFAMDKKMMNYRIIYMILTVVVVYSIFVRSKNPLQAELPIFGMCYLFTSLVASFLTCFVFYIWHTIYKGSIRFKYKKKAISKSLTIAFNDLPVVIILLSFSFLVSELCLYFGHGNNLQGIIVLLINNIIRWSYSLSDFLGAIVYSGLCLFLWFLGVNGGVMLPHKVVIPSVEDAVYVIANTNLQRTKIVTDQFIHNYVFIGGAGCGLAISIAILIKSRSKFHKNLGFLNVPFSLIGISDIIHYAIPIIFNFVLILPFFIVPIVNATIAYFSIYFNYVPINNCSLSCYTPIFYNAYKSTGSISAVILQLILLVIDVLIYLPFIERLNNQKYNQFKIRVEQLISLIKTQDVRNINLVELDGGIGDSARILITELREEINRKKNLTPEAYRALGENLYMVYHPQCDDNGDYVCSEALLRWNHPILGLVFPPLVIELARSGGILHELECVILDETCRTISNLETLPEISPKVSANIVSASLAHPDFLHMVMKYTRKHHIVNENLWIEMNEQDMMHIDDDVKQKLSFLRKRGHKFIIDDFGSEGTSVIYAGSGLFDGLKIDGSLIKNMFNDKDSYELVKSIANMGVKLNLLLLSEFVETEEEMEALKEMYINLFQGYFYSKTLKYDELVDFVLKEKEKR